MSDHLIVVVNRERARFLTIEPVEFPEMESGPRISEHASVANPEAMVDARERYTDSKTGRGAAPAGGKVHGYEDKRVQHLDELRRRFADRLIPRIDRLAKAKKVRAIIVVPSARMQRFVYPELEALTKKGYEIQKVAKNMINFSPQKIQAHLAELGLVPEQVRSRA